MGSLEHGGCGQCSRRIAVSHAVQFVYLHMSLAPVVKHWISAAAWLRLGRRLFWMNTAG